MDPSPAGVRRRRSAGLIDRWIPPEALWPVLPVCAAAAAVFFVRLGQGSLHDWDEAIFAQVAKEMLRSGEWWTLTFNGEPYFNKPPLLMWCTAGLYALFGVHEITARAVSAVSGVLLIGVTFLIGRRLYGAATGVLAALFLTTTYRFVAHARFGTTDTLLVLCIYTAVACYLEVRRGKARWWLPAGAACGLALLTKGPPALLAPVAIVLAAAWDGQLRRALRGRAIWGGVALMVLPTAAWYLVQVLAHRDQLAVAGLTLVERIRSPIEGHAGEADFYLQRLQTHFVPWFPLMPFAAALALREVLAGRFASRVPLLLAGLTFAVFTVVQTKLYWYILPIYPALALLVAALAAEALRRPRSVAWACLIVATLVPVLRAPAGVAGVFVLIVLILALGAATAPPSLRGRWLRALALACLALFAAWGLARLRPLYQGERTDIARIADIAGEAAPGEPLVVFCTGGLYKPATRFYSDRPIIAAWSADDFAAAVAAAERPEVLIHERELPPLVDGYDFHVFARSGPYLYARATRRTPPMDSDASP